MRSVVVNSTQLIFIFVLESESGIEHR